VGFKEMLVSTAVPKHFLKNHDVKVSKIIQLCKLISWFWNF